LSELWRYTVTNLLLNNRPPAARAPVIPPARSRGTSPIGPVADQIIANIEKAIVDKHQEIVLLLWPFLPKDTFWLEDVPGVAKTMLAAPWRRVSVVTQTDSMHARPPAHDITGISFFNPKTTAFEFRPGPLFAQTVLAD